MKTLLVTSLFILGTFVILGCTNTTDSTPSSKCNGKMSKKCQGSTKCGGNVTKKSQANGKCGTK